MHLSQTLFSKPLHPYHPSQATLRNEVQHKYIQDAEARRKAPHAIAATAAAGAGSSSDRRQQLLQDLGLVDSGEGEQQQQQQQQTTVLLGPHRQKVRSRFWKVRGKQGRVVGWV